MRADVLVLGGGAVGCSVAWALAARGVGEVHVLDLDLAGIYASSELNAGGVRATWWQPVNIESCRCTIDFFAARAEELGFRQRGYLWLYDDREFWARAQAQRAVQNAAGLGIESLAVGELRERFPLLDRHLDELVGATFSPRDGLVNPGAVRAFYRARAEEAGVRFWNRHYAAGVRTSHRAGAGPGSSSGPPPRPSQRRVDAVETVELRRVDPTDREGVLRHVLTRHRVPAEASAGEELFECEVLVNCLGAWSPLLCARLGVPDPTVPVRRQIALVDVHAGDLAPGVTPEVLASLGMIVDPSGIYFHPEGPHVLAGFSIPDEPPGYDFAYDGDDFFLEQVFPRLAHRASSFERLGHVRGWAGLYAVTPDRSGIAGPVPGLANVFEAHSFTGRGLMQSYAVGRALAARIATGRWEEVDLEPLSRERFADPGRWAMEDLHI